MTSLLPDAFDAGAEAVMKAKAAGQIIKKADLASIFRTTFQAYSISHPPSEITPHKIDSIKSRKHPHTDKLSKAKRDALFDAFVQFENVTPQQITVNGRYKITEAREQILVVCPDLTPEEVLRRGNKYKQLYPNLTPTSMGLCSNWAACGGGKKTKTEAIDPYGPEPENWKDAAIKRFPGTLVSATPWSELSISVRTDILKSL